MKPEFLPTTSDGRMWRLAEECAEVIKEVAKAGRFGLDNICPEGPDIGTTPKQRLLKEIGDLKHAIDAVERDLTRASDGHDNQ